MCGVFGVYYLNSSKVSNDLLTKACNYLHHRGPDSHGQWINENKSFGLAHTRLSIIDLNERSNQPFYTKSRKSQLVYNGEIYNYKDLSKEYSTTKAFNSDTETLAELLESCGISILSKLDGMFSFAFSSSNKILLAVDPAGKKPLFTYWDGKIFAFSSEIKAFKAIPEISLKIDKSKLSEYLILGHISSPNSIYKNISKLQGGHYQFFDFEKGLLPSKIYWDLPIGERLSISYLDAQVETKSLISNAVKKRLISDVPLGVFLSGGLDSSIVSYEAQKLSSPNSIKTFSASFKNSELFSLYDESEYASKVSKLIKSNHYIFDVNSDFNDEFILNHFDEPFADSSCFPFALLSKYAKKHITVALTGDGGDELFGGYLRMKAGLLSHYTGPTISNFLFFIPNKVKARHGLLSSISRFKNALNFPLLNRMTIWNSFFDQNDFSSYVSQNIEMMFSDAQKWNERLKGLEVGEQILHYNFKTYLANDLLIKTDRMSMLFGIEARSPFLDKVLIEFAFKLPTHFKFGIFHSKKILKDIYRSILGSDITDRKKRGFGFPLETFMKERENYQFNRTREHFIHIPESMNKIKGRNLVSKQYMLYNLETFLGNQNENNP